MTRKSKVVTIVVGVMVIAALGSSVWITIRHAEIEVQRRFAAVEIGMTEAEVRRLCGEPTVEGTWEFSFGKGWFMEYAYPYWWDYVTWSMRSNHEPMDEDQILIDGARSCWVFFRTEGRESRVFSVESKAAYHENWRVVKGTDE